MNQMVYLMSNILNRVKHLYQLESIYIIKNEKERKFKLYVFNHTDPSHVIATSGFAILLL